jgi:hypothetical protein
MNPMEVGNLVIYVRNVDDTAVSGAEIIRYAFNWTPIDRKVTSDDGSAYWSTIPAGTYHIEVYKSVKEGEQYFGALESIVVLPGVTRKVDFKRFMPYIYTVDLKDRNDRIKEAVNMRDTVCVFVTVKNPSNRSWDCTVKIKVDRYKQSPVGPGTPIGTHRIPAGGNAAYLFEYTPTEEGTHYVHPQVTTYVNNNDWLTDYREWTSPFSVTKDLLDWLTSLSLFQYFQLAFGLVSTAGVIYTIRYHRKKLGEKSEGQAYAEEDEAKLPTTPPQSGKDEERRRRLDLVYGPLYGAITEIRKNIPSQSDLSRLTVGFPVDVTQQYKIMEEIFTKRPHLVRNKKITEGWRRMNENIKRYYGGPERIEMWMTRETDSWFTEIEKEYKQLMNATL